MGDNMTSILSAIQILFYTILFFVCMVIGTMFVAFGSELSSTERVPVLVLGALWIIASLMLLVTPWVLT